MKKRTLPLLCALLLLACLVGCTEQKKAEAQQEPPAQTEPAQTPEPEPAPVTPEPEASDIHLPRIEF